MLNLIARLLAYAWLVKSIAKAEKNARAGRAWKGWYGVEVASGAKLDEHATRWADR